MLTVNICQTMYAKLFSSLYQGTLRGRSNEILVFTNLLAHCDKEGYVDKHFRAIADETGVSVEEVKSAIATLEAPDDESRSPECEGRRIVRIDDHRVWGWQVVNFEKYRGVRDEEGRRETWRKSQKKRRDRLKSDVNTGQQCQPPSTPVIPGPVVSPQAEAYTEAEAEASGTNNPNPSPALSGGGVKEKDPETPPKPKVMPDGWKKLTQTKKGQCRVNYNTPAMILIGKALGRRDSTLWTVAETEAYMNVKATPEEIDLILSFYQASIPPEEDRRRHSLDTLLNHWSGECDKARAFIAEQKKKNR